jgi:flagellar hook-basal body complex protein FliE
MTKGQGMLRMTNTQPGHLNGRTMNELISEKLSVGEQQELNERLVAAGMSPLAEDRQDFATMLMDAMNKTSQDQNNVERLTELAIVDPESVDVHELTIAMAKANMSLSLSKAIIDRTVTGFKDILSQR